MGKITGSCQCGAVRYEVEADPMFAVHCQCLDCRKSSGSGHITAAAFPADAIRLTGTTKAYSSPADSGAMTTREVCPECGGRISFRSEGIPGMLAIQSASQIKKFTALCGAKLPPKLLSRLDELGENEEAVSEFGIQYANNSLKNA